ncbi:MAG TPA: polyphosphate polymerase domain-containing protein [Candidatus Blautia merdavium]|uniref:Polyphosphate polymerase domain-containing protein n=1 Tax=Candidatus Blautia merdavium TaxID=2838494 RepID=A0A9D2PPG4_9FIRM|nr:polyphosphate polymerase domain-containing protein [Candidatus Blautia merdavium]
MNEVLRQEKKYLMNMADVKRLSGKLSQALMEDDHNGANGYSIRSLYFDTPYDGDFRDKVDGLLLRKKIRLRIYDPKAKTAKLEMKQKEGMYQRKRSLRLSREDAAALIDGDYGVLLKYREPFAAECYGVMCMQGYRPKTVVEYLRKAYIAKENSIRITFDSRIIATEARYDIFAEDLNLYPVLDPFNAVLEVKYNGFLLSYIKDLLDTAVRSELSVSKYCLARGISQGFNM